MPTAEQKRPIVPPPVQEPPVLQPTWFGNELSTLEIALTSGAVIKIKEVRLYDAKDLNDIAAQKARAAELLNGVPNPYGVIGDPLWVVFTTKITGMIEEKLSRDAAIKGFELIQKLAQRERKLREDVKFFPVGQIQEIENPVPSLWRVPSPGCVHNGDEFVTVKDTEGIIKSIRWNCVECYDYQANK